eukprot:6644997-Pyramimonas_sp.AAC.1
MPMTNRVWSHCGHCKKPEYNDKLEKQGCKCGHCGKKIRLFRPRSASPALSDKRVSFEDSAE